MPPRRRQQFPPVPLSNALGDRLYVHCLSCCHGATFSTADMIGRLGAEATFAQLKERLRCTSCGAKGGGVSRVQNLERQTMSGDGNEPEADQDERAIGL